jgi:hypothetical protein
MRATIDTWIGGLGLLTGFCLIAAWLAIAGRPADAPAPSAEIRLGTAATGELAISPLREPVLKTSDLRPGDGGASGIVNLRNETPRPLDVAVRATAVQKELDGSAWIELSYGDRPLMRSVLRSAHDWSPRTIHLDPGQDRNLAAQVWLPEDARDGWQAARGDLTLEFRPKAVRNR